MLLVTHRTPFSAQECRLFEQAGANAFEIDVQERHGRIVVSHFLPVPGTGGRLQHDLGRPRVRGLESGDANLDDVLGILPTDMRVLLDPKEVDPTERRLLMSELIDQVADRDRFWVSTHHVDDLDVLRAEGFHTWRTVKTRRHLCRVLATGGLPDEAVSVRAGLLDEAVVASLHEVVGTVVAWTVNRRRRAQQLQACGVDGVTTDSREVMRALG